MCPCTREGGGEKNKLEFCYIIRRRFVKGDDQINSTSPAERLCSSLIPCTSLGLPCIRTDDSFDVVVSFCLTSCAFAEGADCCLALFGENRNRKHEDKDCGHLRTVGIGGLVDSAVCTASLNVLKLALPCLQPPSTIRTTRWQGMQGGSTG